MQVTVTVIGIKKKHFFVQKIIMSSSIPARAKTYFDQCINNAAFTSDSLVELEAV
jgi:hypothetical protein